MLIPFCNQVIAKCFAQPPRGLRGLAKKVEKVLKKCIILPQTFSVQDLRSGSLLKLVAV
jgi:hypothetical protein